MAAEHPAAKFAEGQRVELIADVDRYPHFIAHKGMTGRVAEVDGEYISVRLDEHLPNAEPWDNEVIWTYEDLDHIDECVRILA